LVRKVLFPIKLFELPQVLGLSLGDPSKMYMVEESLSTILSILVLAT
jgi:hypothetical protein